MNYINHIPALISWNLFPLFFLECKSEQPQLPITQQYYQNGFGPTENAPASAGEIIVACPAPSEPPKCLSP
jgi:hypothetical protein